MGLKLVYISWLQQQTISVKAVKSLISGAPIIKSLNEKLTIGKGGQCNWIEWPPWQQHYIEAEWQEAGVVF